MTNRLSTPLLKFLGIIAAGLLPVTVAGAALAAPTITVTKVSNTATQMTLKVVGSGFTRSRTHQIEVDSNFAFSGSDEQLQSVNADGNGKFTLTFTKYLNASCAIGVFATDLANWATSNSKDFTYGSPCLPPRVESVHILGSTGGNSAAVEFTVNHFTPLGSVTTELTDLQSGQVIDADYSVGASGKFTTHAGFPYPSACGHTVQVTAYDDYTDTPSITAPTVVLCKNL